MNKIHHFGDSYGSIGTSTEKHFVELIADEINYHYVESGVMGGQSNEQILNLFLDNIDNFKRGDIVFFNFSFFCRAAFYNFNTKNIQSTNSYYADDSKNFMVSFSNENRYIMDIISHLFNHEEDYNRRIFTLFDTVFKNLIGRGVAIYYIYIVEYDFSFDLLKHGTQIKFPTTFLNWLVENDYHKQESCHYTSGIQDKIKNYIVSNYPDILNLKKQMI